jgi:hypothetical protein
MAATNGTPVLTAPMAAWQAYQAALRLMQVVVGWSPSSEPVNVSGDTAEEAARRADWVERQGSDSAFEADLLPEHDGSL